MNQFGTHNANKKETDKLKKQVLDLEAKLKETESKLKKDTEFYQEALQKRFDQMEEYQEKAENLEMKVRQLEK